MIVNGEEQPEDFFSMLYDRFFVAPERFVEDSYRDHVETRAAPGPTQGNWDVGESSSTGQSSGQGGPPWPGGYDSQLAEDEALARCLQDMEIGDCESGTMSVSEPVRTGTGRTETYQEETSAQETVVASSPTQGNWNINQSILEQSWGWGGQSWPENYNLLVAEDEALARRLQDMEIRDYNSRTIIPGHGPLLGTVIALDSLYGNADSVGDTETNNHEGTSAQNSISPDSAGGAETTYHGGTSSQGGHRQEADVENVTYEDISQLGQSPSSSVTKGLSKEQISKLPTHPYGKGEKDTAESECSICMMEYTRGDMLIQLRCHHQYHRECIALWLRENNSCCLCKRAVL